MNDQIMLTPSEAALYAQLELIKRKLSAALESSGDLQQAVIDIRDLIGGWQARRRARAELAEL